MTDFRACTTPNPYQCHQSLAPMPLQDRARLEAALRQIQAGEWLERTAYQIARYVPPNARNAETVTRLRREVLKVGQ